MTESEAGVPGEGEEILTLEPLLKVVRETVEDGGWALSGVQKTTSYEYGGRWEGDSTRSAYAFFHRPNEDDGLALDVFLDETSQGLVGNLALVVGGPDLGTVDLEDTLSGLSAVARACVSADLKVPLSLRARLSDASRPAASAELECRFKVLLPRSAIRAGGRVVRAVVRSTLGAFEAMSTHPEVRAFGGAEGAE